MAVGELAKVATVFATFIDQLGHGWAAASDRVEHAKPSTGQRSPPRSVRRIGARWQGASIGGYGSTTVASMSAKPTVDSGREGTQMNSQPRSADEEKLEFFVGDWHNSGHVSPGPFGPGGAATGETSYRWGVGGRWLLYSSRLELPGVGEYHVHGGVAYNHRGGRYDAYAINSFGNLLVYEGRWADAATLVFTLVHPRSHVSARVVYRRLPDGSITMRSEHASAEGELVPYFETSMVRSR